MDTRGRRATARGRSEIRSAARRLTPALALALALALTLTLTLTLTLVLTLT